MGILRTDFIKQGLNTNWGRAFFRTVGYCLFWSLFLNALFLDAKTTFAQENILQEPKGDPLTRSLGKCLQTDVKEVFARIPEAALPGKIHEMICEADPLCKIEWMRPVNTLPGGNQLNIVRAINVILRDFASGLSCELSSDYWLFVLKNGKLQSQQNLWNGFAYQKGKDPQYDGQFLPSLDLQPNFFRAHRQSLRGFRGFDFKIGLNPVQMIEESYSWQLPAGGAEPRPPERSVSWNWKTFSGQGENVGFTRKNHAARIDWQANDKKIPYLVIPRIDGSGEDFMLDHCAVALGTLTSPGFTLSGHGPRPSRKGLLRALLVSDRVLLVDIYQQKFTTASKWTQSDHLEVWQAIHSTDPWHTPPQLYQWGIELANAKVFPGLGKAEEVPVVERTLKTGQNGQKFTRLKITLPFRAHGVSALSLSYSAQTSGRKGRYLLSTSQIQKNDAMTLSEVFQIPHHQAGCLVQNGLLQPAQPTQRPKAHSPFFELRSLD